MPSATAERIPDRIIKTMDRDEGTPELVGREKEMGWLVNKMMDVDIENNNVVTICGMRGIGKTALVRNAYCRHGVKDYFTHRIWVTMSYPLDMHKLLRNVLQQVKSDNPTSYLGRPSQDLRRELVEFYEASNKGHQLRCLLVFDDLPTIGAWDLVKSSLFLEEYKAELRIIVITREFQVAKYCSKKDNFVCDLRQLDEDDATKLLRLKIFGRAENVNLDSDMVKQERKILGRCGGIPFAIVDVGRHLASRPLTAKEWESRNKNLKLHQLQGDPELESLRTTLESCYSSLAYHVKYCFMYLSIFEEDVSIMRRRLVKRWIAEGYMKGMQGPEAEELGERVFNKFLSMTIIQPTKYAAINSGRVTSCSVHPLMLQLSTSKAKEEKLVCILEDAHDNDMASKDTIRHVVVRSSWSRDQEEEYKSMNISRVRSLTVFGVWRSFLLLREMRMLRVLDLEGVKDLKGCDLKHIGEFRHLKYLGLRSTDIEYLPKSVGMLQGLETLDIRYTNVRKLPSTVVNLKSLRVLRAGLSCLQVHFEMDDQKRGDRWSVDVPMGVGELRKLITLGTVSIRNQDRLVVQDLGKLTQLQRLSVTGITDENGAELCSTLQHLSRLQSLTVHSPASGGGLFESLRADSLQYPLGRLQVLKIYGSLNILPRWISGSRDLVKVYLQNTRLNGPYGSMNVLADLPNLTTLLLLENSVMVYHLTFQKDGFRELELLELANLGDLRSLSFEAGRMPKLKTLQMSACKNLAVLSFEAGAMSKLETLRIESCESLISLSFGGAGIKMPILKSFQVGGCDNLPLLAFQAGDMPNLEMLILRHSSRLLVTFEEGAMRKLKALNIDGCCNLKWLPGVPSRPSSSISSLSIEEGMMPNLEKLLICRCHALEELSFREGALLKLESLKIEDCSSLKLLSCGGAATRMDMLKEFNVSKCSSLELLQFGEGDMSNLETLVLCLCENLFVEFEADAMRKLKMLRIYYCRSLQWLLRGARFRGGRRIFRSRIEDRVMPNLETLEVGDCHELKELFFDEMGMLNLRTLKIFDCSDLEQVVFKPGTLDNLETLEISGCPELTEEAVSGLQDLNPRSKHVSFGAPRGVL